MYTWIIYDISENKTRTQIAKWCKALGLKRVQKSVFLGVAKKAKIKAFRKKAKRKINLRTDKLIIVPITKTRFKQIIQLGKKFKPKGISGGKQLLFF